MGSNKEETCDTSCCLPMPPIFGMGKISNSSEMVLEPVEKTTEQEGDDIMHMLKGGSSGTYEKMVKHIKTVRKHGHKAILLELNRMDIGIGDFVQKKETRLSKGKKVTVFKIILDNVFNGHDLIIQILDSVVKKIPKEKCSKCFDTKEDSNANIEIELKTIFRQSMDKTEFERSKMRLINDLLDIQSKSGNDNCTKQIFQHPVIEILILKKWQKHKVVYFGIVRFFALFVFLFTFFVRLRLLEEDEKRCINAYKVLPESKNTENITDCADYLVNQTDFTSGWVKCTIENTHILCEREGKNPTKLENTHPYSKITKLLIFKYNETSFNIFAFTLGSMLLIQLFGFLWVLLLYKQCNDGSEHKKERMLQTLKISSANMCLISFGIFVCVSSSIPQFSYIFKGFIFLCWLYIVLSELHQLCFLVLRPAWEGFNLRSLQPILRHRYFRDPENYLELFCILSIPIALITDAWARYPPDKQIDEHNRSLNTEAVFRGAVAIGVFSAWSELFIKLGNVSTCIVGDFTKMFYNIIKSKLWAYMKVCMLLIVAFSLAFWVILHGHLKENGVDFSKGFWMNLVLTVTMSTGEFDTGDFYGNIGENAVIKAFAMLFLIGLVILTTITMINLLVAAIINDYQIMKDSVDMENLYFITEYIVEVGEIRRLIYHFIQKHNCGKIFILMRLCDTLEKMKDIKKMTYCPHLICNSDECKIEPLPIAKPGWKYNQATEASEREPLLLRLLEIRKGNKKYKKEDEENFCYYHKYGLLWSDDLGTWTVDDDKKTTLSVDDDNKKRKIRKKMKRKMKMTVMM